MATKDKWVDDPQVRCISASVVLLVFAVTSAVWLWAPGVFGFVVAGFLATLVVRVIKLEVHNGI